MILMVIILSQDVCASEEAKGDYISAIDGLKNDIENKNLQKPNIVFYIKWK